MTYVVTSFDFGGSSNVKIHVATDSLPLAQDVYAAVCGQAGPAASDGVKVLVELTQVPKDISLLGTDALTLFWGSGAGMKMNNNRVME